MAAQNLQTIAPLCADFQQPYDKLKRLVVSLGLEPALTLNGLQYFDESAIEELAAALRAEQATAAVVASVRRGRA
ncbi:MAG: hypothetical protein NTY19_24055 [Planctomycetota bacterium]|nr:hypothetical protein [Planctomycetota bacterium]